MEFLALAVGKLLDYTLAPIARQVGYMIFYRSNTEELKKEADALQFVRERVQHEVDAAIRNGELIERDVQKWLQEVDEITSKFNMLNNDERHAKTGCFSRPFPNLCFRKKLSRQSKKLKEKTATIKTEGNFHKVSYQGPPKLIWRTPSTTQLDSRLLVQKDIMKALKDPTIHTIGVHGLPGVGKTTLAEAVAKQVERDETFKVVWANVTQSSDLEKIQQQIAHLLGLKFEVTDLSVRASQLYERLKRDRILIILDDLWEELNMDKVGIPPVKNDLKIIMTSRSQELLSNQMNTQKNFFLDVLRKEEAWKLFKEKAQLDKSTVSDEFQSIATQVFEECACLPIAIVTIASSLRSKDLSQWKDVLRQLKDPAQRTITSMQKKIFKLIKVSYDMLENDLLRSIFLLCGVIRQNSLVTELFNNSFGLGLFEEIANLEDARNSLHTCICKLKDSCLLLDGYSPKHFSMHDVVQDVAIHLASMQQHLFIKRYRRLEEWPEGDRLINCRTIILDHCNFAELPEGLYCPSLTLFNMNNKIDSLKISDRFFEGMLELRVLNLTVKTLDSLPSSIRLLSKLRTLFLNINVLGDLGIIGELKSLRVLTLSYRKMTQLPLELSQLTRLQLLDLRSWYNLVVIPSNLLSRLTKLEELYLPNNVQWRVDDPNCEQLMFAKHHGEEVFDSASYPRNQQSKASLAELNDLVHLTTLEVCIRDENMLPKDLVFERLKRHKVIIGSRYCTSSSEYETSKILQLGLNTSIHSWHNLKRLLNSVEVLYLKNLKGAENVIPRTNEEGMQKLKCIEIYSNDEIQTFVDSSGRDLAVDVFPNLESLAIKKCNNSEEICNGSLTGRSFSRLRVIKVDYCKKMKSLFSLSRNENATRILQLSELQSLSLNHLLELISFWHEDQRDSSAQRKQLLSTAKDGEMVTGENIAYTPITLFNDKVMLPNLEEIIMDEVNKLNTIWHWEQQLCPKSFEKLKKLVIQYCPKLVIIFPSHIGNSLHNLETLLIENCEALEHVFDVHGVYGRETHSEISGLPAGVLCFPNLQQVGVERCKRLKYLFPSSVAKTLGKLQSLKIEDCSMIEEIIIKEQNNNPSSSEEITFSKLKFLNLRKLPRLKSFSFENFIFKFPSLEDFLVIQCIGLITFSEKMPSTPNLENVQIGYNKNESCWEGDLNATIQKIYTEMVGFPSIKLSELTEFPQLKELWQGHVSGEFKYLTSLEVDGCEFDSNVIIPFNVLKSLTNLKEIEVSDCESVEAVFDLEGINNQERNVTLIETQLKKLTFWSLPDLKHVWNGDGKEIVTFQNLQTVTAYKCEQLKSVFPANISKGLTQLEELSIWDCGVKEIVAMEEGQATSLSFMFPELTNLTIQSVPNLKCFYPGEHYTVECPKLMKLVLHIQSEAGEFVTQLLKVMPPMDKLVMQWQQLCPKSFDKLKKLDINTCSELVTIFSSHIGSSLHSLETLLIKNCESLEHVFDVQGVYARETHNEISCLPTGILCFPNLRQVYVEECKRLKYLFPLSVAKTLVKLQSLQIGDCSMIEEIIIKEENNNPSSSEENGGRDHEITFSSLYFLKLWQLSRLGSFSSGNFIFKFPALYQFTVIMCTTLRTFSQEMPSTPVLAIVQIGDKGNESCWEGDLNATIQKIYRDMTGFHSICLSELTEFPQLKKLWQGHVSMEFKYLTSLVVDGCEFDSNVIIPVNVLKSLTNLKNIEVRKCELVEAVFDLEGISNHERNVILATQLKKLKLESLPDLKYVWNRDCKETVTFQNLQTVTARKCEQLTSVFPANIAKGLTQLEELIIQDCGVKEIVTKEEGQTISLSFMFPELTNLIIWNVPSLKCFYPGDCTMEYPKLTELFLHLESETCKFVTHLLKVSPNLETLGLNNIVSVTSIWPQLPLEDFRRLKSLMLHNFNAEHASILNWNLQRIPNLKELYLVGSSFKEVFTHERHVEGGENFLHLKCLTLLSLPELEHIYKEGLNLHKYLMHLEELSVQKCYGLKELVPSSAFFNHLVHLEVYKCDGLLHLVTSSTAKSFVQLTTLKIKECSKIREIVIMEENEDRDHEITFRNLGSLEFDQLSSLKSFSFGNFKFNFPSLEYFVVNRSPKLTIFSKYIPDTPILQEVETEDYGNAWYWEGNLNATIHKMYSDMNVEKSIQDADLSDVDTLP